MLEHRFKRSQTKRGSTRNEANLSRGIGSQLLESHSMATNPLGKRANATQRAWSAASRRVADAVSYVQGGPRPSDHHRPDAVAASFPEHGAEHTEYFHDLASAIQRQLHASFESAWTQMTTEGQFADLLRLLNELDQIEAEAEARKEAGRPAKDIYRLVVCHGASDERRQSTDPELVLSYHTRPMIDAEVRSIRAERQAVRLRSIVLTRSARKT